MAAKYLYTVTLSRPKTKVIQDGFDWEEALPDSLFAKKFKFDGNEYGPLNSKRAPTYTIFWTPTTFQPATQLLGLIHKQKSTKILKGSTFKMTIHPR